MNVLAELRESFAERQKKLFLFSHFSASINCEEFFFLNIFTYETKHIKPNISSNKDITIIITTESDNENIGTNGESNSTLLKFWSLEDVGILSAAGK